MLMFIPAIQNNDFSCSFPYIASNFLHVRDIGASWAPGIPNLQPIIGEAETKTESYIDYINYREHVKSC